MKAKNKRILIGVIIVSLMIAVSVQQHKAKNEQRKQAMIEKMSSYLRDKYNEEFEYVSRYSFIVSGQLQKTYGARFRPVGEPDLEFDCTDGRSLGLSDGFLIVLGQKVMQPYGEQVCQDVFKNGEKYLVYAQAVPYPMKGYKKRPTFQSLIDNQVINNVSFDIVVSLYGEYEKEEIRQKVYEIGQLMKKEGIRKGGSIVIKVYDTNAEILADNSRYKDREGLIFEGVLGSEYDKEFTLEDISIEDR